MKRLMQLKIRLGIGNCTVLMCAELGHFFVTVLRPAYQALRKLNSKPSSQVTAVRLVNGQIVSDPVAVWEHWADYFEQLYQVDPPIVNLDAGSAKIPLPGPPINEDSPSLTEGKGDRCDCSNHRGITLLSILGKVLTYLLLSCIRDHLLSHQQPGQSGFTPEHHCQFGHGLLAAYIDRKKAFDTVHQESLWEILRLRGIRTTIIGLIASLYTGTEYYKVCRGLVELLSR
ncbi:uncharacterized protein [Penaeus vannamei]|uniref:uncharacterized protein n=1 Tax=Penaeus vannamei TaxID=6689 RepID=UPI00387F5615